MAGGEGRGGGDCRFRTFVVRPAAWRAAPSAWLERRTVLANISSCCRLNGKRGCWRADGYERCCRCRWLAFESRGSSVKPIRDDLYQQISANQRIELHNALNTWASLHFMYHIYCMIRLCVLCESEPINDNLCDYLIGFCLTVRPRTLRFSLH